ncbi:unnamed protein product [Ostreobium quekettii]|uniref:Uncharacterized protein n=1 Tax=Ostreobium quekettii TaxID=121088 RepID=A0A8S1J169_9CHLO|nr:unnamed protein product [Ostreobium quekettii]|eukprot:evm.model.scf_547EXC.4 EVM.evm.TU.scf_547EXC.4   scf_547EXC:38349-41651(-)
MMGRGVVAAAFLVLIVAPFVAEARGLRAHTSTSCDTNSKAALFLTSGSGYASATAYCEAEAKAKDAVYKVVTDWVHKVYDAPKHGCTAAEIKIAVEGFAQATARAFADVRASAEIQGTGKACAGGSAEGDAFAAAVLDVALEATLTVVHEKRGYAEKERVQKALNQASGEVSGRAVSAAIASAWAAASESVCTKGYKVEASESALGQQVRTIVAKLFGEIAVTLCEEPIDEYETTGESTTSESTSTISGEIKDDEFAVVEGNAGVGEDDVKPCEGLKGKICCRSYYQDKDTCRCGMRCQMETLVDYSPVTKVKIWEDKKGEKCMCVY